MAPLKALQENCVHHWIIEMPEGPTSMGQCKKCGLVREFMNVWPDSFNQHQVTPDNSQQETDTKESVKV